jgi:hypothetical protein
MSTLSPIKPIHKAPSAVYWGAAVFVVLAPMLVAVFLQFVPPVIWDFLRDDWMKFSFSTGAQLVERDYPPPASAFGWFSAPWVYVRGLWPFLSQPRIGFPVLLHILAALTVAMAISAEIIRRIRDEAPRDILAEHVRGPRALWGQAGETALATDWRRDLRLNGPGVRLAPNLRLSRRLETEGLLLAGRPGSGKSVILEGVMAQALERNARVVALDVKGQLAERLKRFKPHVLSLFAEGAVVWEIGRDLVSDADADEFAACLVPDSKDPVWSDGSRLILSAMVQALRARRGAAWGWTELYDLLSTPIEKLEPVILDFAPGIARLLSAREEPASFIVSLMFNLAAHVTATARRFAAMEENGAWKLSLRRWASSASKHRNPIVLHYDLQRRERSGAMVRLALRVLSGVVLGREVRDGVDSDTWIFLDEIARLGRCDPLADLASLGRSRGIRVVMTVQSPAQLVDTYGAAGAEALRENFATQLICAMPAGDNAQRVAKDWIGDRVVREPSNSVAAGEKPQEWTLPALSREEISGELGLNYDLLGRPRIRAAVLSGGDVAVLDWPLHRWPRLG